jgi:large subunit ribosomal protein L31
MKKAIHPKYYSDAKVTCACGNAFTVGATFESIHVDVCSACHPFYTGQMKYLDAAGRIDAFKSKLSQAKTSKPNKTDRRAAKRQRKLSEELSRPETLAALRSPKLH